MVKIMLFSEIFVPCGKVYNLQTYTISIYQLGIFYFFILFQTEGRFNFINFT